MRRLIWLSILLSTSLALPIAAADQHAPIEGVWKLVSYQLEFQDGGQQVLPLGDHPNGWLILTSEGRMMVYFESPDRKAPQNLDERAEAYRTMMAYTGRYRVSGDKWSTRVDGAWNVEWVGTEQERTFSITGDRMNVLAQWNRNPLYSNRMTRGRTVWQRELR